MTKYVTQTEGSLTIHLKRIEALLSVLETLPEGNEARGHIERAVRSLQAESFLDENRRVSGHPFQANRSGDKVLAGFCRICTWSKDLHD